MTNGYRAAATGQGPARGASARQDMERPARRTRTAATSSATLQLERRPMVVAPEQHEGEAEHDCRAFEDRAQGPARDASLDHPDQRHERRTESVELPPSGLHGVLLLP